MQTLRPTTLSFLLFLTGCAQCGAGAPGSEGNTSSGGVVDGASSLAAASGSGTGSSVAGSTGTSAASVSSSVGGTSGQSSVSSGSGSSGSSGSSAGSGNSTSAATSAGSSVGTQSGSLQATSSSGLGNASSTVVMSNDLDCDGVTNNDELAAGTNPLAADSDNDGIPDGVELGRAGAAATAFCPAVQGDADPATTTNPLLNDSDMDGILDGAEDADLNGLVDTAELDPNKLDTDGDLIPDGLEDLDHDGLRSVGETDGTNADTDADGIPDGVEDTNHNGIPEMGETDPRAADSDSDGLVDGVEDANHDGMFQSGETLPLTPDTDADGILDGLEDANHDGVVDAQESSPRLVDTDGDGLEDHDEDANADGKQDVGETRAWSSDSDCDGLGDRVEALTTYRAGLRTNPVLADTDQDGVPDGVELSMVAAVPGSACTSVAVDVDPQSRTSAVDGDSDRDGRLDGCEDANGNGRVDPGELNPNAFDSDADGLGDAAEDANGDCVAGVDETNGALKDSDQDGIPDGVELATTHTNPLLADSDQDGIPDGLEDRNQNGKQDRGESNPNAVDSDMDGLPDGLEDTNHNGVFDAGETNASVADTDGDGLRDGAEDANHDGTVGPTETDPRLADTDGDGLPDGDELLTHMTNPRLVDTDNDGLGDLEEVLAGTDPLLSTDPGVEVVGGVSAVCTAASLKPVQFKMDAAGLALGGDWTVALEDSYAYQAVTAAGGDHVAAFQDSTTLANTVLAGFVMDIPLVGTGAAAAQAQALLSRLTGGSTLLGAPGNGVSTFLNGRPATSSDGFGQVVDLQVNITLNTATDPNTLRNRVVGVLSNRALNTFTGLPAAGGATTTNYVLRFNVVLRNAPSPGRLVVLGGVVGKTAFDNTTLTKALELKDLANGTALARAYSGHAVVCAPQVVTRTPKADFIWMADISGSTDNDRGAIAAAAGTVFTALQNTGVDFRMGVVPSTENSRNDNTPGDLRSGFTRAQATFIADLNNISTAGTTNTIGSGCEFGLTATDNAITKALPRTTGAEAATKLRSDAQLVVFYISDETAQEVEMNLCGLGNLGTGQTDGTRSVPLSAAQQTAVNNIVAPFITRIQGENGLVFGQLTPIQSPFCADTESGEGYLEVVNATGGTFYRTCDSDPGAVLQTVVDGVAAAAGGLSLPRSAISATLKVALNRAGNATSTLVPRSASSGFDYDAKANSIFFRGTTYRPAVGDTVTVSFLVHTDPVPPPTCASPLVLNASGTQCQCPADPMSGMCGAGAAATQCGATQACNTDPAVCGCECLGDCGGALGGVTGNLSCGLPATCGPVCRDLDNDGTGDCNFACTGAFSCNSTTCGCECQDTTPGGSHDCGGYPPLDGRHACDENTCTVVCAPDCGGCAANETCHPDTCSCVP